MISPAVAVEGVDLSHRTKLRLTGADRLRFLNGQVSNDVRQASETASIYTCVMTIKGKMCADAFIHAAGETLWLDAEPAVRESLAARLEKYIIADDVTLEDASDEVGLLHLFPAPGNPGEAAVACAGLRSIRTWRYGQVGLDLFGPRDTLEQARVVLAADARFLDAAELETRRILAGVPKWGAELDENTMPAEAGLEARAVSYSKGCYIGQEVVSRVQKCGSRQPSFAWPASERRGRSTDPGPTPFRAGRRSWRARSGPGDKRGARSRGGGREHCACVRAAWLGNCRHAARRPSRFLLRRSRACWRGVIA